MTMTTSPARILEVNELAAALGLPRYCTHAVLTLSTEALPTLVITTLVTDYDQFVKEDDPDRPAGSRAERIKTVMRKFNLVPIAD